MLADTSTVQAEDGRTLAFCEWGDRTGRPVWYLHGSPGSRYLHPREFDYTKWGVRMLTWHPLLRRHKPIRPCGARTTA